MILAADHYDRLVAAADAIGLEGGAGVLVSEDAAGGLYAWPPKKRFWWTLVDLHDRSERLYEVFPGRVCLVDLDEQLRPGHCEVERAIAPPKPLGARHRPSTLACP